MRHSAPPGPARLSAVVLATALLAATPTGAQPAAGAAAPTVSPAQFAALRWLRGDWRGALPDGGYFYERYTLVNDSTLEMQPLADASLAPRGAPMPLTLRAGVVRYDRATATRVDSTSVDFATPEGHGFAWRRDAADRWTAVLRGRRPVVYRMERVAAPAQGGDRAAVRRAVLDYVEGFYEGDTAKLLRSVWPQVRKYGYGGGPGGYEGEAMAFPAGFVGYANGVRTGRYKTPPNARKDVTVYDVQDQTASAKLDAWWGSDYLLLARENGRWMITHVLWQSRPRAARPAGAGGAAPR